MATNDLILGMIVIMLQKQAIFLVTVEYDNLDGKQSEKCVLLEYNVQWQKKKKVCATFETFLH